MEFYEVDWPPELEKSLTPTEKKALLRIKNNIPYYHDLARPIKRKGNITPAQRYSLDYWDQFIDKVAPLT